MRPPPRLNRRPQARPAPTANTLKRAHIAAAVAAAGADAISKAISAARVRANLAVSPAASSRATNAAMVENSGATAATNANRAVVTATMAAVDIVADAPRAVRRLAVKPCQPLRFESH